VTGEREQDTWVSLATTLLTPREVVRAKQLGAVWSARWIGMALVVLWTTGLVFGALHPLGVLAAALITAIAAWLTAAIGVLASSRAKNSIRALGITFIALFLCAIVSTWPLMLWTALAPFGDFARLSSNTGAAQGTFAAIGTAAPSIPALLLTTLAGITFVASYLAVRRLRATWGNG